MAEQLPTSPAVGDYVTASWGKTVSDDAVIVDSGTVTVTPTAANTAKTVTVPFNKTFPSPPAVVLTMRTGVGSGATAFPTVDQETTTGFDLTLMASTTTARNIRWLAVLDQ